MSTPVAVADIGIERLVRIEARIGDAEGSGLRARWEFGRELLAARGEHGRLPNRYLTDVAERVQVSRSELKYRMQFAERYPTEDELATAVASYRSWWDIRERALAADVPGVSAVPDVPKGQFATIVADPPWRYGNTSTRGAAEDHYPTMSIDELCDLGIAAERSAEQAHLYLWTTAGHLPDAFRVVEAWGFTYKTYLVWVKPQMGMGNYFRVSTELVLFGVKGSMRTRDMATLNYFEARRGKHSAKPQKFYDLVTKASPGPYLEMFARCDAANQIPGTCQCAHHRLGWEVWGNQA
jgi:N6-adenosine-specific RNA methylase IME4